MSASRKNSQLSQSSSVKNMSMHNSDEYDYETGSQTLISNRQKSMAAQDLAKNTYLLLLNENTRRTIMAKATSGTHFPPSICGDVESRLSLEQGQFTNIVIDGDVIKCRFLKKGSRNLLERACNMSDDNLVNSTVCHAQETLKTSMKRSSENRGVDPRIKKARTDDLFQEFSDDDLSKHETLVNLLKILIEKMDKLAKKVEYLEEQSKEMHAHLIHKRKIKFAPHQIVKYSLGSVEVLINGELKLLQYCDEDEIKREIEVHQKQTGALIRNDENIGKEAEKRHFWTYLGRPTAFAFAVGDFLWPRNKFSTHHCPSMDPLKCSKLRSRKDQSKKEYIPSDEVAFYRGLSIYVGACILKPNILEHWLEEGRTALVRRGTEIKTGKRKPDANKEEGFTPVFCRGASASTHLAEEFDDDNNLFDDENSGRVMALESSDDEEDIS